MTIKLIVAICLALIAVPAQAEKVVINDTVYDVKGLVKIEPAKAPQKGQRFTYKLLDREDELVLSQPIESENVPDLRPYAERHPYRARYKRAWKFMVHSTPVMNCASAAINLMRALGVM